MTAPIVEFNPVQFCESLYPNAWAIAKKRLGVEPQPHQVLMLDLILAFRQLRQSDYSDHFGLVVGDLNEGMAIIKAFLSSANPKAPKILHPELGLAIGSLIQEWVEFEKAPKDIKTNVRKATNLFSKTEDKFMVRLNHFFNEMKVRTSSLEKMEKDGVIGLIGLYQPQARNACHRGEIDTVLLLLTQLVTDLKRLALQTNEPSRPMELLLVKTQKDLSEIESSGNKGKKARKKPPVPVKLRTPRIKRKSTRVL